MQLHLPEGEIVAVETVDQLRAELSFLSQVPDGCIIELKESEKHSIRAERDDHYWIVTAKRKGWLFRQTLTTGDWIDPKGRSPRAFWRPRGWLTDAKVEKVFLEFFQGKKFSQPIEGAG